MGKKQKTSQSGVVYSTNPSYNFNDAEEIAANLLPAQQKLRIWLETKHRGGKAASIISGYSGSNNQLEQLAKQLKAFCGTGGSVKDGEIIIQGDQRDKLLQWLLKNGYTQTKKAGG
jgi:translation initiation factor 1